MKHTVKDKVLRALIDKKEFVSGEELSREIGVTRTSIWKATIKLKDEGYDIESVTNKGYRLLSRPDSLSLSLLAHDLERFGFGTVQLNDTIDSTNLEAKRQAPFVEDRGAFISHEQTLGKGRRGRTWVSPSNTGLYISLLLRPEIEPNGASMITLLAGLSVCRSLRELYNLDARIKWPNDIVISSKKVSGILTEMSAEIDVVNYIVVGIGINISQKDFPIEIQEVATSLELELNKGNTTKTTKTTISKHGLIYSIVEKLDAYLSEFKVNNDLQFIKGEYEALCLNVSGVLRIEAREGSYLGKGLGITPLGELQIEKEDGTIINVNSGEVSVRGLYGYV